MKVTATVKKLMGLLFSRLPEYKGYSPAGLSLAPHLWCLRCCGFCRLSASAPESLRRIHVLYCLFTLASTTFYMYLQCIYAYQGRADMDKFSRVMFLLLCHITSWAKQIVFNLAADRINDLMLRFDEPALNQASAESSLAVTALTAYRLQRAYSGCAVITCILWAVFPVVQFARGLSVEFPFWVPFALDHSAVFVSVMLYSFYCTTLVAIGNTTMDAFMCTVFYQCTTQIKLIRKKLETLPARSRELSKLTGEPFDAVRMKLFYECLHHYDKISEISNELQDIFGRPIFIQFMIGGWILCLAAYKLVSLNMLSMEFTSITLFIICILTELFLYCFFGNDLTSESALILDSLYACGWESGEGGALRTRRGNFGRALLLAGERARRPLTAAAAGLITLSLDTFLKILKSSYTFYAVLRQTK